MDWKTVLIEVLFAGFFAVALMRAHEPEASGGVSARTWSDFFRLSGRWDRLRRTRWQWFALVSFMLVLRLQQQLPLALEVMVALQFALFMALPRRTPAVGKAQDR